MTRRFGLGVPSHLGFGAFGYGAQRVPLNAPRPGWGKGVTFAVPNGPRPFWGAHPISRETPSGQASVAVCLGCPWDPNGRNLRI